MQLEHIVVHMRSRTGWEAIDLGGALVRHGARDIFKALAVATLPLLAVGYALSYVDTLLGVAFLWWTKPVLDAVTLSVLARSLIGERIGIREVFFTMPRALQPHLIGALLWRRLSPSRTLTMPVRHLEGLTGQSCSDRIRTLTSSHRGSAQLACVACLVFDLALFTGLIQALATFAPTSIVMPTPFFNDVPSPLVTFTLFALAQLVTEPLFAAIGFALYINRRVDLEGWDLELAFRALRGRLDRRATSVGAMVAALLLALLPMALHAQEPPPASAPADELPDPSFVGPRPPPSRAIKEVLSDKDFDDWGEVMVWQSSDPAETAQEDAIEEDNFNTPPFVGIGAVLAEMVPWILGALGVVLVAHLTIALLRGRVARGQSRLPDAAIMDEDWAPKPQLELPSDVVAFARGAFARGEAALALSVLYRGAIAVLAREAEIDFPEGATEQECVVIVRRQSVELALREAFESIARTWQRCAYAHSVPEAETFAVLCERYASTIAPFKRAAPPEVAA